MNILIPLIGLSLYGAGIGIPFAQSLRRILDHTRTVCAELQAELAVHRRNNKGGAK